MLFNSYEFIFLYLPVVLVGFFWISRSSHRLAALWLAAASLFFYGWWNPQFVLLLLASIGFNYAMGYAIGYTRTATMPSKKSTWILVSAVTGNLLLLGYFKYTNFFIGTANQFTGTHVGLADIVLPLGISFFTFTQIAFLVDVHRGIALEYNFIHYMVFITYFPHLIAGPVLHHKQMMPQFGHTATYKFNIANFNIGLTIFTIGLFKKIVLADQFAHTANPVFDAVAGGGEPKLIEAWIGALAYTLQLYFDFSGYSDMAIGLSKMFNVNLPLNFNSPYKATNIIEFWRRWHMTLSAFLRDYLYIPLGGNRYGIVRRHANVMTTMLLGGLWHGANWTFVLWGGLHGVYLVVNHGWHALRRRFGFPRIPGGSFLAGAITFVAVVVAWVLFRADSVNTAGRMLSGMAGLNGIVISEVFPLTNIYILEIAMFFPLGLGIVWLLPNTDQWMSIDQFKKIRWTAHPILGVVLGVMFGIALLAFAHPSQFLYFQF